MKLALLLLATSAQAHGGPDGGIHHALPYFLAWLPFVLAAHKAGWKTVAKAMWFWLSGGREI